MILTTILILVIAFLSLIALMAIHEFGHFIIAKKFGARVEEFGIGYPPRIFGKKIGETVYSINLLPLGAFVRIYGEEGGVDGYRSFSNLKIWQRFLIVIGGVAAFWIAAIIIFSVVFSMGADLPIGDQDVQGLVNARVIVMSVSADSPASQSGLQPGDIILKAGFKDQNSILQTTDIQKIKDFQDFTIQHAGQQVLLEIDKNGQTSTVSLEPRVSPPAGQGAVGIGLERMATLIERTPWYLAPVQGAKYTWETTVSAFKGFYILFADIFSGRGVPQGAGFAGPIGITVLIANAASYGVGFFLYFIGVISVFVAIFNLFPIPALDGGKIIFLIIEKIKGKPVSVKIEQTITIVCFSILIILSIFVTIRFDIPRLIDFFKSSLQR